MLKPIVVAAALLLGGCQSAYYSALEQVGIHKRDILVDRVEDARDAQDEAQQQFRDALAQYRAVVQFEGGQLEQLYDRLQAEYDDSAAAAEQVSARIEKVESVANALFAEWQEELGQYQSNSLRTQSERQLNATKRRYGQLLHVMRRAEKRMQPVLRSLHDNVLYLKHNLNARAIGALKGEFAGIRQNVDRLVRDMQRSIDESDAFIQEMQNRPEPS